MQEATLAELKRLLQPTVDNAIIAMAAMDMQTESYLHLTKVNRVGK